MPSFTVYENGVAQNAVISGPTMADALAFFKKDIPALNEYREPTAQIDPETISLVEYDPETGSAKH